MTNAVGTTPVFKEPVEVQRLDSRTTLVTMAALSVGLVIGIILAIMTAPQTRPNPYPSLTGTFEPLISREVAAALVQNDARGLGHALNKEGLQALGEALQPITSVLEVRFLGAVERNGEVLAAYAVQGRDRSGQDLAVGFVLHVVDDKVVGVN